MSKEKSLMDDVLMTAESLFSSDQERRLWALTLALVVAIYSTLGLATTLANELRNRDLFDTVAAGAFLLMIPAVVMTALKTRPRGVEIGVALSVAVVYLLVFLRMVSPEERSHMAEYGLVATFIYEALRERASQRLTVNRPALLAIGVTASVGTVDEGIQLFLPDRVFAPIDIFFNALAAELAVAAIAALRWPQGRRTINR